MPMLTPTLSENDYILIIGNQTVELAIQKRQVNALFRQVDEMAAVITQLRAELDKTKPKE